MHLLATTTGVIDGATEAVDLAQSPGDIVVLTAADSEIASLARAGEENARGFLQFCRHLPDGVAPPAPASLLAKAGVFRNTTAAGKPAAAIVFYRSVVEGAQTSPIAALAESLEQRGLGTLAI